MKDLRYQKNQEDPLENIVVYGENPENSLISAENWATKQDFERELLKENIFKEELKIEKNVQNNSKIERTWEGGSFWISITGSEE